MREVEATIRERDAAPRSAVYNCDDLVKLRVRKTGREDEGDLRGSEIDFRGVTLFASYAGVKHNPYRDTRYRISRLD